MSIVNTSAEISNVENNAFALSEEQILILQMSDKDITANKLVSQEQLDKNDLLWLKKNN
jgi:hypothetical protein